MKIDKEKVFDFIMDLPHYATWTEVLGHFGFENSQETERALKVLLDAGDIIVDPRDDNILVTRVTSKKLQDMLDKSVRIR